MSLVGVEFIIIIIINQVLTEYIITVQAMSSLNQSKRKREVEVKEEVVLELTASNLVCILLFPL